MNSRTKYIMFKIMHMRQFYSISKKMKLRLSSLKYFLVNAGSGGIEQEIVEQEKSYKGKTTSA